MRRRVGTGGEGCPRDVGQMTRMQRWMLLSDEERKLVADLAAETYRMLWEVFDELYP